jgi:hypothetical protein
MRKFRRGGDDMCMMKHGGGSVEMPGDFMVQMPVLRSDSCLPLPLVVTPAAPTTPPAGQLLRQGALCGCVAC